MAQELTNLMKEYAATLAERREVYVSVESLLKKVVSENVKVGPPPTPEVNLERISQGYDLKAKLQQLQLVREDALELLNKTDEVMKEITRGAQLLTQEESAKDLARHQEHEELIKSKQRDYYEACNRIVCLKEHINQKRAALEAANRQSPTK